MSAGWWAMAVSIALLLAALVFTVVSMIRSMQVNRVAGKSTWQQFGLGLGLMILFFGSWVAHLISQWQVYTDEQFAQGNPTKLGDFVAEFGQATLENWQSEFLQLFSFVVLAALYVHRGSAESKDGDDRMEASLHRIEQHLGTLPASSKELPDPE